jgi:hypothetical protein
VEDWKISPASYFFSAAVVLLGLAGTGLLNLATFYAAEDRPDERLANLYWVMLAGGVVGTLVAVAAWMLLKSGHDDFKNRCLGELKRIEYQAPRSDDDAGGRDRI